MFPVLICLLCDFVFLLFGFVLSPVSVCTSRPSTTNFVTSNVGLSILSLDNIWNMYCMHIFPAWTCWVVLFLSSHLLSTLYPCSFFLAHICVWSRPLLVDVLFPSKSWGGWQHIVKADIELKQLKQSQEQQKLLVKAWHFYGSKSLKENKALSTSIEDIQLYVLFKYVYSSSTSGHAAVYAKYMRAVVGLRGWRRKTGGLLCCCQHFSCSSIYTLLPLITHRRSWVWGC